jgi:hypothetical protein
MTYACRYCDQVFGGPNSRRDHEMSVHRRQTMTDVNDTPEPEPTPETPTPAPEEPAPTDVQDA